MPLNYSVVIKSSNTANPYCSVNADGTRFISPQNENSIADGYRIVNAAIRSLQSILEGHDNIEVTITIHK